MVPQSTMVRNPFSARIPTLIARVSRPAIAEPSRISMISVAVSLLGIAADPHTEILVGCGEVTHGLSGLAVVASN